jgi:hypothetical protein
VAVYDRRIRLNGKRSAGQRPPLKLCRHRQQHRFLHVQPIFRLIEDGLRVRFQSSVVNLLAAMRGAGTKERDLVTFPSLYRIQEIFTR